MSSNFEKEVNESLENGINALINGLIKYGGIFFKGIFLGCKKLKNKYFLIGFLVSFIVPIVVRLNNKMFFNETEWYVKIIYFVLLITPLIYLFIISKFKDKVDEEKAKFEEEFRAMGLIDIKGNTPQLIKKGYDELSGTDEYYFKTIIPIKEWKKLKEIMESTLNITIFNIRYGESKQCIIVNLLSGDVKMEKLLGWKDEYISPEEGVITIGKTETRLVSFNLNKEPHVLVAGATGSGKSVALRSMLWQVLMQGAQVYMVDLKGGVEYGYEYENVGKVIIDPTETKELLEKLTEENKRRLALLRQYRVKNFGEYNNLDGVEKIYRICVFIDEFGELMDNTGVSKEAKAEIDNMRGTTASLARLARATGINIFVGIQRPDANVVTGQIKSNLVNRICGRYPDGSASEIVLDNRMAKDLDEIKGRMIFQDSSGTRIFQSFFFDDNKNFDIEKLKEKNKFVAEIVDNKKDDEEIKEELLNDKNIEEKEEVKNETESKENNIEKNTFDINEDELKIN